MMRHTACSAGRRPWASALFTLFVALCGLAGCAGQQATISPTVVTEKEALGRGVAVVAKVRDVRPASVIGRCNPTSTFSGKLTVACDPAPAIRAALEKGLREKGFRPVAAAPEIARSLGVELADLRYTARQEGDRLIAKAVAVLAVAAGNNGQVMRRKYTGDIVWKLNGDNVEPDFDRLLSQAVSKAISRLVSDYELMHFLEKTVLRTRDLS